MPIIRESKSRAARRAISAWPFVTGSNDPGYRATWSTSSLHGARFWLIRRHDRLIDRETAIPVAALAKEFQRSDPFRQRHARRMADQQDCAMFDRRRPRDGLDHVPGRRVGVGRVYDDEVIRLAQAADEALDGPLVDGGTLGEAGTGQIVADHGQRGRILLDEVGPLCAPRECLDPRAAATGVKIQHPDRLDALRRE